MQRASLNGAEFEAAAMQKVNMQFADATDASFVNADLREVHARVLGTSAHKVISTRLPTQETQCTN